VKVWLDLANSPQVLFFRPILAELQRRGHTVAITTRAYAQTTELADQFGMQHTLVGRHGGRSLWGLASELTLRAGALARWARPRRFDLALSHNSYAQVAAAAALRLPAVTLMDYEHQPLNHLCFRLARRVIVPESFPAERLSAYGARGKTVTYPGVKEQIYLADFVPDGEFRSKEGLPADATLVVIRPPASWTAYHRFESDLFDDLLSYLGAQPAATMLFLPRLPSQADSVRHLPAIRVATKVYDGPNLLYHADLAISGGGTMNREAAVLGTPTYTAFKGKLGAVDRYLIARGRMMQLQTAADLPRVRVERKPAGGQLFLDGQTLVGQVTDQILAAV